MSDKSLDYKLPKMRNVKNAEEARDLAIDWQDWSHEQNLSYGEVIYYQNYFEELGTKFNLTEEFKENAIC